MSDEDKRRAQMITWMMWFFLVMGVGRIGVVLERIATDLDALIAQNGHENPDCVKGE